MYGMTEEQFWRSNPRIIKVWQEAWKMQQNRENQMMHLYFGTYGMSALSVVISQALDKHSHVKYIDKPVRIFELTPEEKRAEEEASRKQAVSFFNNLIKKYGKEGEQANARD